MLVAEHRLHVSDNQRNWYKFVQPLTYHYDRQLYRSTNVFPFFLFLTRHTWGPTTIESPTVLPTDVFT